MTDGDYEKLRELFKDKYKLKKIVEAIPSNTPDILWFAFGFQKEHSLIQKNEIVIDDHATIQYFLGALQIIKEMYEMEEKDNNKKIENIEISNL